jgi:hypothetical protein
LLKICDPFFLLGWTVGWLLALLVVIMVAGSLLFLASFGTEAGCFVLDEDAVAFLTAVLVEEAMV